MGVTDRTTARQPRRVGRCVISISSSLCPLPCLLTLFIHFRFTQPPPGRWWTRYYFGNKTSRKNSPSLFTSTFTSSPSHPILPLTLSTTPNLVSYPSLSTSLSPTTLGLWWTRYYFGNKISRKSSMVWSLAPSVTPSSTPKPSLSPSSRALPVRTSFILRVCTSGFGLPGNPNASSANNPYSTKQQHPQQQHYYPQQHYPQHYTQLTINHQQSVT